MLNASPTPPPKVKKFLYLEKLLNAKKFILKFAMSELQLLSKKY